MCIWSKRNRLKMIIIVLIIQILSITQSEHQYKLTVRQNSSPIHHGVLEFCFAAQGIFYYKSFSPSILMRHHTFRIVCSTIT
jgi:hypothetical protein